MKEIILNGSKTLSTGAGLQAFDKLEIPVTIAPAASTLSEEQPFMEFQVTPMLMNSTLQLSLSYCHGDNQVIAALYGPSEAKGFKSDAAKAIIELTIKDMTTKDQAIGGPYTQETLRSELKSILEQVISLNSYPKTLIQFQLFIEKKESEAQLFATCANALFTCLN